MSTDRDRCWECAVIPYFKHTDMTTVTTLQLSQYVNWRVHSVDERQYQGWHASTGQISLSSLRLDISLLRSVLRQGKRHSLVLAVPEKPKIAGRQNVYDLPTNRRGRGRFSEDQYSKLSRDFASVRRRLNNQKNQPVLADPSRPPNPIDNQWQFVENRHSQSDNDYLSRWRRYSRAVARFACILVSNTGIRPVELMKLKFKDVKLVFDSHEKVYTAIEIDQSVSKVKRTRQAIAANGMEAYRWLLEHKREVSFRYNIEASDDTWLFPSQNDHTERADNLQHHIRKMLKRLDLHTSAHPYNENVSVYYSLYSFRSWYAVKRLEEGVDLYALSTCFGASVGRIIETYNTGEGLNVRARMIKLMDKEHVDFTNIPDDLKEHAEYYAGR